MKTKRLPAFLAAVMIVCAAGSFAAYADDPQGQPSGQETVIVGEGGENDPEPVPELIDITGLKFKYKNSFVFDGEYKTPEITVSADGTALVKDGDFKVRYSNNLNVGTGYATVTGIGQYTGTVKLEFAITAPEVNAPAELRCSDANLHIMCLRWKSASGVSGYQLEYYDSKAKKWTGTRTLAQNKQYYKYESSSFEVGTTYKMRIRSYKVVGGKKFYSDWVTAYATTDPAKVTGIKQSSPNTKGYTLSWNAANGAMMYEVLRWSPDSGKYEVIATVSGTKYVVKDRTPGQKNTYKVRAIRKVNGSDTIFHGAVSSFKATSCCDVVDGIKAKVKLNSMTVTWNAANKATGYEVYYTDAKGNNPVTLATVDAKTRSYTYDKFTPGKKYKIKVKAISKYGTAETKSKYPAGCAFSVFNNVTCNSVLDSYVNNSAITVTNSNGYTIPQYLKNELSYTLTKLGGIVSYAMLDLDSGTLIASNGKTYMGTASTVKMPFMLYSLHEMEDGYPTLDTKMVYTQQDYHPGSGIIQTYNYGTVLSIGEIFSTIFTYSDNIGFYMLQRQFGIDGYNKFISSLGCRVTMNYYDRWGYICATDSCKEWMKMYEYFDTGRYGGVIRAGFASSCASNFRKGIGHKYTVYSKCGWTETYHHDTAVVEAEHPYVLISFTNRVNAWRLSEIAIASDKIHQDMWNYFNNR